MLNTIFKKPGWLLPTTRTKSIDLHFILPATEKGARVPQFSSHKFTARLAELNQAPLEQIRLLRGEIKALSRCRIGPGERLESSRQALSQAYPIMLGELRKYAKEGGIPDSPMRQETLDWIVDILHLSSLAYLAVFKHHYDKPDAHFERDLDEVRLCACRILELIRLEQRACGLRYQTLSDNAWRLANTVFHIMREHDDIARPVAMLDSEMMSGRGQRETTLAALYGTLHITNRLDMLRWPVGFQNLLVGYQETLPEAILAPNDPGRDLARESLIAYCHDDRAARSKREAKAEAEAAPATLIDWSPMAKQLRSDCLAIIKASRGDKIDLVPGKLRMLSSIEKLALAQLLLRGMEPCPTDIGGREREESVLGMQIYVGFVDTYNLVKHILSGRARSQGMRFVDLFAERSATIALDHNTVSESLWFVLYQDARMIRLKTQETQFTSRMEVGSLLAYGLGEKDRNRPRLGVVSRLHRPNATSAIIDIDRLAKYAEPVTVKITEPDRAGDEAMHALLIHDPQRGWNLLFSPQYSLADTLPVAMDFRGREFQFRLGGLRYVTAGFYLFGIPLDTESLGLDAIPSYPKPEPESTEAEF